MQHDKHPSWQHGHGFGQDQKRPGEVRTIIVIAITGAMMVVEIATGILFGSMALLADGLHMASHAAALSINVLAYIYARRYAHDHRYTFGTGKVNALGGFTGAILLAFFALIMAWESIKRFVYPVEIAFNQAIFVAVLGLIVNGVSVFILGYHHDHQHRDGDDRDHNLKAAYLHVLADALTSCLAIFALLTAKYLGLIWMDPFMGIVGAILVSRWSFGLIRDAGGVLLDKRGSEEIITKIKNCIEKDESNRISDLHLWSVGPNINAVIITVVTSDPKPAEHYKRLIPSDLNLVHVTVEVHQCTKNLNS
ncbi:MAG: CDF family Co(II)/Ni(II) efflux transporter DmeF [Deltaproteobacteria bacterium]|nr:CDF family Co(II)/Ni(II) efflux transporter DmeF [Deltaproteobacteria bacterium]